MRLGEASCRGQKGGPGEEGAGSCGQDGMWEHVLGFQTLTGDEVTEGNEQTARELRKLVEEDPAPSDTKFSEETTTAKAAHKNAAPLQITVRTVTRRLRGSEGTEWSSETLWVNSKCCDGRRSLSDCARSCETR